MRNAFVETVVSRTIRVRTLQLSRQSVLRFVGLTAIVVLAAALRFSNLAALGYANHYYTAAVKSMLQSWHNFFFVAAEPGGSVSVDKPPVGLWLQTLSAYFFGVNGFAVLLPEIVAGIASVIVVYHLVRRWFGTAAGMLAALALAITPVVVATDRNNTIDSTLIFTLLLASWAFIKATEKGKLRFLLLGAALVGIGFNIKMLEAYLPLPAFYALYFLGSPERLGRKVLNLAVATVLLLGISFSWAVAVDMTPASQRPYVGSSGDNSEISLILGYNGAERLLGMGNRGGLLSGLLGGGNNTGFRGGSRNGGFPGGNWGGQNWQGQMPQLNGGANGAQAGQPNASANGVQPRATRGANGGRQWTGFGGPGGGMMGTGRAGLLRLFSVPLSKEVSWLLPFGLFAAVLLVLRTRLRWPLAQKHQAVVLWGGWLLTGGVFFSIAGFFHQYYLSMLAPPLAALVGIGFVELWRLGQKHRWLASGLLLVAAGATLALQMVTAQAFVGMTWWQPVTIALLCAGAVILVLTSAVREMRPATIAGFVCVIAALLLTPGIWSGLTMLHASDNQSLPAAYSGNQGMDGGWNGGGRQSGSSGNNQGLQVNQALLDYLQKNTQGSEYLMAVPSSMQGADYVIATGRPVLYMGGFMGEDQVLTPDKLAQLVAEGKLRYVYWDGRGRDGFAGQQGTQASINQWITTHGTVVQGFETQTQNSGAPDGTGAATQGSAAGLAQAGGMGFTRGGGRMQVTLYDLGSGMTANERR